MGKALIDHTIFILSSHVENAYDQTSLGDTVCFTPHSFSMEFASSLHSTAHTHVSLSRTTSYPLFVVFLCCHSRDLGSMCFFFFCRCPLLVRSSCGMAILRLPVMLLRLTCRRATTLALSLEETPSHASLSAVSISSSVSIRFRTYGLVPSDHLPDLPRTSSLLHKCVR